MPARFQHAFFNISQFLNLCIQQRSVFRIHGFLGSLQLLVHVINRLHHSLERHLLGFLCWHDVPSFLIRGLALSTKNSPDYALSALSLRSLVQPLCLRQEHNFSRQFLRTSLNSSASVAAQSSETAAPHAATQTADASPDSLPVRSAPHTPFPANPTPTSSPPIPRRPSPNRTARCSFPSSCFLTPPQSPRPLSVYLPCHTRLPIPLSGPDLPVPAIQNAGTPQSLPRTHPSLDTLAPDIRTQCQNPGPSATSLSLLLSHGHNLVPGSNTSLHSR